MAKPEIELSGYSDDCASITGIDDSEYDVPGRWYDLLVDGVVTAKIRIVFERSEWVVQIKSNTHKLKVAV